MTVSKRLHEIAVLIEFLVGSGLAIFFHAVLNYEQAAYIIFGVGVLLSLVTYLVREDIEKTKEILVEQYRTNHEITGALAAISDPDCQLQAHELITATVNSLKLLQQGYMQLDEMSFYLECARLADRATRQINCVDPLSAGWLSRATLVNYYQSNLRAMERGVQITRVFVTSREEFAESSVRSVLGAQCRDGVDVRLAFREELPKSIDISGRDGSTSFDFGIYDQSVATDAFAQPGKYFGHKTTQAAEVAKYLHLYNLIEHSAHVVSVESGRVVLSAAVVPVAESFTGGTGDADRLPSNGTEEGSIVKVQKTRRLSTFSEKAALPEEDDLIADRKRARKID